MDHIEDLTPDQQALIRADKLIQRFMCFIGDVSPGPYNDFYSDLNFHCLYMERNYKDAAKENAKITR